ncbi:MAG: hypothetical protein AAF907_15910, partial [Planctomycetota bacterium]
PELATLIAKADAEGWQPGETRKALDRFLLRETPAVTSAAGVTTAGIERPTAAETPSTPVGSCKIKPA